MAAWQGHTPVKRCSTCTCHQASPTRSPHNQPWHLAQVTRLAPASRHQWQPLTGHAMRCDARPHAMQATSCHCSLNPLSFTTGTSARLMQAIAVPGTNAPLTTQSSITPTAMQLPHTITQHHPTTIPHTTPALHHAATTNTHCPATHPPQPPNTLSPHKRLLPTPTPTPLHTPHTPTPTPHTPPLTAAPCPPCAASPRPSRPRTAPPAAPSS